MADTTQDQINERQLTLLLWAQRDKNLADSDPVGNFNKNIQSGMTLQEALQKFSFEFENFINQKNFTKDEIDKQIALTQPIAKPLAESLVEIKPILKSRREQIKTQFIPGLVAKYLENLKKRGVSSEKKDVAKIINEALELETPEQAISESLLPDQPEISRQVIQEIAPEINLWNKIKKLPEKSEEVIEVVLTSRDNIKQPDQYVKILTAMTSRNPTVSPRQMEKEAVKITLAAEAFSSTIDTKNFELPKGQFFNTYAKTAAQKAGALVDVVLKVLPTDTQQEIKQLVVERAWKQVVSDQGRLTQFGEATVNSAFFQQALKDSIRQGGQAVTPPAVGQITNIIADVVGTIGSPPTEAARAYLETAYLNAHLPPKLRILPGQTIIYVENQPQLQSGVSWMHFALAAAHQVQPNEFSLNFLPDFGGFALRLGAEKAAAKAFPTLFGAAAKGAASTAAATGFRGFLSGIFVKLGGIFAGVAVPGAGWAATIAALAAPKILEPISGFFGKFARGEVGPTSIFTGAVEQQFGKPKKEQDLGLLAAGGIVVILLILIFAGDPKREAETTELLLSRGEAEFGGFTPGDANAFCDPTKRDCRWPTTGCFTQGPFSGGLSHGSLNAIDIAGALFTPVYATHQGKVNFVRDSFILGQHQANSYGNYVDLGGVDEKGSSFFTRYGHLAGPWMIPVKAGQTVSAGQLLGFMDDTGFSTGSHLHYEYNEGGLLKEILPFEVPRCNSRLDCQIQLKDRGLPNCI